MNIKLHCNVTAVGALAAAVILAGLTVAVAEDAKPKDLRAFYRANCVKCHGADGSARSAEGKSLRGEDFTDADWQKEGNDAKMAKVILKGKFFGKAMPGFAASLTQDEAVQLVKEVLRKTEKGKAI